MVEFFWMWLLTGHCWGWPQFISNRRESDSCTLCLLLPGDFELHYIPVYLLTFVLIFSWFSFKDPRLGSWKFGKCQRYNSRGQGARDDPCPLHCPHGSVPMRSCFHIISHRKWFQILLFKFKFGVVHFSMLLESFEIYSLKMSWCSKNKIKCHYVPLKWMCVIQSGLPRWVFPMLLVEAGLLHPCA